MKRVIIHWSGGSNVASKEDRRAYHYIVQGDGSIVEGDFPVEANAAGPLVEGKYAAHTAKSNTGSIGVSLAGMHGAVERPFDAGRYPITETQMRAAAALCARLCRRYGIDVTRRTVLTHAEVEPTLGIKQAAKWDIARLPWTDDPIGPIPVGDWIRDLVVEAMKPQREPTVIPQPSAPEKKGVAGAVVTGLILLAFAALVIFLLLRN